MVRAEGIKAGMLRLITVWPIPATKIKEALQSVKTIVMPEMNMGQITGEIERISHLQGIKVNLIPVTTRLHEPNEIISKIKEVA